MKLTEDEFQQMIWRQFMKMSHGKIPMNVEQKQILDDYEKARKWDKTLAHGLFETGHVTLKDYTNALRLRELLEQYIIEIEDYCDNDDGVACTPSLYGLQKILKDSKK